MHEKLIFLIRTYVRVRYGKLLGITGSLLYKGNGEWFVRYECSDDIFMVFHESWVTKIEEDIIELVYKNV